MANLEPLDGVVSSDDEQLILVDRDDREIGFMAKADAHGGRGVQLEWARIAHAHAPVLGQRGNLLRTLSDNSGDIDASDQTRGG